MLKIVKTVKNGQGIVINKKLLRLQVDTKAMWKNQSIKLKTIFKLKNKIKFFLNFLVKKWNETGIQLRNLRTKN